MIPARQFAKSLALTFAFAAACSRSPESSGKSVVGGRWSLAMEGAEEVRARLEALGVADLVNGSADSLFFRPPLRAITLRHAKDFGVARGVMFRELGICRQLLHHSVQMRREFVAESLSRRVGADVDSGVDLGSYRAFHLYLMSDAGEYSSVGWLGKDADFQHVEILELEIARFPKVYVERVFNEIICVDDD